MPHTETLDPMKLACTVCLDFHFSGGITQPTYFPCRYPKTSYHCASSDTPMTSVDNFWWIRWSKTLSFFFLLYSSCMESPRELKLVTKLILTKGTRQRIQLTSFKMPRHDRLQHTRYSTLCYCVKPRLHFESLRTVRFSACPFPVRCAL